MDIKGYLSAAEKRYPLRLKTVVPLDDDAMDAIERAVAKFQPLDMSRPKKTILQNHPLDFQAVINAEVWIVDMVFGLPASPNVVRQDIRKALDAPEEFVVVRDSNEPIEVYTEFLDAVADIDAEAARRNLVPEAKLASTDYPETELPSADTLYGNAYNTALLAYLHDVAEQRPERRVDPVSPLFSFLKMPQQEAAADDFNADIAGAPPVGAAAVTQSKGRRPPLRSLLGAVQDSTQTVRRVYRDADGKRVVITRTLRQAEGK